MSDIFKNIKSVGDFEVGKRRVFLRLDLNVPLDKEGKISDTTRLEAAVPTIKWLLDKQAKLVIASHLGRPKANNENRDNKYSLEPVGQWLQEKFNVEVHLIDEPGSEAPKALLPNLRPHQIILLENLRYDEGETSNKESFSELMSSYTDIYINDAFGASHRAHASIVGVAKKVNYKGMGFLVEKEIKALTQIANSADSPYIAVMGGAKVSDKIPLIENLMDKVDGFIVGGAMAYTFLAAQGVPVGESLVEKSQLKFAKKLLDRLEARNKVMHLPVDHKMVRDFADPSSLKMSEVIDDGFMAIDIGRKTIASFEKVLSKAKTVFWNGPMGAFETKEYSEGTFEMARILSEIDSFVVVGGGDSASAAAKSGYAKYMDHVSTGGGAALEFLMGQSLPGIEALRAEFLEVIPDEGDVDS